MFPLFSKVRNIPLSTRPQGFIALDFSAAVAISIGTWLVSMRSGVRALMQMDRTPSRNIFILGLMRLTTLLAVCALAIGAAASGLPGQESRAPRNVAEFDQLFKQVSNWGWWGKDDQLGSWKKMSGVRIAAGDACCGRVAGRGAISSDRGTSHRAPPACTGRSRRG
jgi:hypothetical protein